MFNKDRLTWYPYKDNRFTFVERQGKLWGNIHLFNNPEQIKEELGKGIVDEEELQAGR